MQTRIAHSKSTPTNTQQSKQTRKGKIYKIVTNYALHQRDTLQGWNDTYLEVKILRSKTEEEQVGRDRHCLGQKDPAEVADNSPTNLSYENKKVHTDDAGKRQHCNRLERRFHKLRSTGARLAVQYSKKENSDARRGELVYRCPNRNENGCVQARLVEDERDSSLDTSTTVTLE